MAFLSIVHIVERRVRQTVSTKKIHDEVMDS